jgi:hypothetical protein
MCCSCFAAILAGINLWWTVDDTPLASAMQRHASISASWDAVEAGSLMMLITVVIAGGAALFGIIRFAWTHHRTDVLVRLSLPPLVATTPLTWAVVIGIRLHWLPTPWDVTGDWTAPTSWPPLALRWELSTITTLLLLATVLVAVIGIRGAINRSQLSEIELPLPFRPRGTPLSRLVRIGSIPLAASMGFMLVGVVFFGAFTERYDPGTFHSRAGGLFGSPMVVSWTASVGLFLAACVAGLHAARLSFRPVDEALGR